MAWSYVQGKVVDNVTSIALPSVTPTKDNLMVVVAMVGTTGATLSISDTQGNSWTKFTNVVSNDGHGDEMVGWWAVSKNSSATTISISGNGAAPGAAAYAEYSGNDTASPEDVDAVGSGVTGTTATDGVTTGALATTVDGDLIVSCCFDASRSAAPANPGTGFTSRAASSNTAPALFGFLWEDKVQSAHGSITPTYTDATNGGDAWTSSVAAFKPLAGGAVLWWW